ncbi:hypothetical protein Psuf_084100 [Phytohabitans suffuscus]|uniref:Transmembrane protein n=1 Tax=Phytohabitans suffuscus TaxID=624315 RepID=A0A6F8YY75_9ACTN|nr:hypothetical protein [Phytohabitans suffuscus]BCB91097.1 hypothetical protein Psuf_084100 [Phytohabitans suffuscus]
MRARLVPHAAAALITAVVLAPLAAPGYVLRYDMVFVPRQPLRWEMVAPADALPRAVPLDALVSVANLAVPGWLLQRLALAGILYFAALGMARLVPTGRLLPRLVGAFAYAWTPYLAERLLLGQWGLLLAYAALPWLVAAARDVRAGRPGALARLVLAAAPAAVTPTGGLVALATVVVLLAATTGVARQALAAGAVAALCAPWVVAAVTGAAGGRSDPAGVDAFAARAENWSGAWGAVAGTGGIWNAQTVPGSRASPLVPLATLALLAVCAAGYPELRRRWPGGAGRLAVLAGGSLLLALAGTPPAAPGMRWLVANVAGAGLLRDGQKFLIPYALLVAVTLPVGAEVLARRLERRLDRLAGRVVLAAALLLPVAILPDLAFGAGGELRPVRYPADWTAVSARISAAPGEVLSLPFHGYQRYRWNRDQVVRDPAPRLLGVPVLMNDALQVGDVTVDGESPRAARVRAMLASGEPVARLGVRWVLVREEPGQRVPAAALAGLRPVYDGRYLALWENPAASGAPALHPRRWWAAGAHLLAALLVVVAGLAALCTRRAPWYRPHTRQSEEGYPWPSWPRSSSPPSSASHSGSSASTPPPAR